MSILITGDHNLSINTSPFSITLSDNKHSQIIWQLISLRCRSKGGTWHNLKNINLSESSKETSNFEIMSENGDSIFLKILIQDSIISFEMIANNDWIDWLALDFLAKPEEHFFGFGERFDSIDQRGKQVDLWVEDGSVGGLSYIPVPFYISTSGYGLFLNNEAKSIFRMATPDDPSVVSIRVASSKLNMLLFQGETPKEILSQYTSISGRPEVPPNWVFGPWKSRDWQTADQVGIKEDVEKQLDLNLPASVKLIDARWEIAYHTFEFDKSKFPDPQAMINQIHNHGSRVVLWISPWMAVNNANDPNDSFFECVKNGYLIKNTDGEVYINQLGLNPMLQGACIDFTNPQAVSWWQEKIQDLVKIGVNGFNTDFGEQIPDDAIFYNGLTGREMHNIYPRIYNEITFEAMQINQPGMLLARSGWHGSQKLSAIWAGDQTSDFSLVSGLRSAIIAGITSGISGFPYWACDIGGYFGTPTDEIYMRWTQFGAFSPVMMIHGAGLREPWAFSDKTLSVYREFAQLHTDLFPYIHTYAKEASLTGIPIMRAMALEFPEDPGIWQELSETQYCFGSELLVAPIFYGFSRVRMVYLPEGLWCDYWTGKLFKGGQTLAVPAEIEQIPVFAKAGAIIPYLDPSPDTLIPTSFSNIRSAGNDLRLDIYPGENGIFKLDDGTLFEWDQTNHVLTVKNSPIKRQISIRIMSDTKRDIVFAENDQIKIKVRPKNLNGDPTYARLDIGTKTTVIGFSNEK